MMLVLHLIYCLPIERMPLCRLFAFPVDVHIFVSITIFKSIPIILSLTWLICSTRWSSNRNPTPYFFSSPPLYTNIKLLCTLWSPLPHNRVSANAHTDKFLVLISSTSNSSFPLIHCANLNFSFQFSRSINISSHQRKCPSISGDS